MSRLRVLAPLVAALALAACGDDEPSSPDDELLEPPAPGEGVQFAMTTSLEPGVEAEHCLFVQGPDEEIWITRDEARFDLGSHHVLLYETGYDEIPTEKQDGTPVDTSGVFDCTDGATNGWDITKLIAGSQNATGDSMIRFPEGVAMPVRAGAVLLMNVHYINASDEEIEPEARMNLHTIPEEEVDTEGDLLFLYNPLIRVPAEGTSRARWRCPVHEDITIANVQSHMHARGVGFAAMVGGEEEPFYENEAWSEVEVKSFEPFLEVPAGSSLEYFCDYRSGEDRVVYQGPRSTDEMCMLIGSYYPADPRTANCEDDSGQTAGEWIGDGSATCAETMECVFAIDFANLETDPLQPISDCMVAADPDVSRESSEFLICLFAAKDPVSECAEQIAACQES
jgi:Copper type II ascorbate-dependent monooxygenase, C-terminal domain